jgi:hypothetical protein
MTLATKSINKSFEALVSRKIDSRLAQSLLDKEYTLSSLSQMTKAELSKLHISAEAIDYIHAHRPRIPSEVFNSVLFKSRWTCSICHDPTKDIILHHIEEWAESRDHSEKNLVVLCLNDHGKAHSQRQLSLNLNAKALKAAKKKWEQEVRASDARNLVLASVPSDNSHCWYHINHPRIFSAAKKVGVDFQQMPDYPAMLSLGLINSDGLLTLGHMSNRIHAYAHGSCMVQYSYVHDVMTEYLDKIALDNVSDYLDKGSVGHRIREGDTIYLQGAFTFKDKSTVGQGLGQNRKLRRRVGGVEFVSNFDGWDSTSTSAWGCWLKGRQSAGALLKVRSIKENSSRIKFKCTTLAVAFGLNDLKSRRYGNYG